MTFRVPHTITNHTISFFAKGRMYSVSSGDSTAYPALRAALMTPEDQDHDLDQLLGIVDLRYGLVLQSQGQITLVNDEIMFRGEILPLTNLWVEKILTYRLAGEPYSPIWNALAKLVHNPTKEAVERLPIFLERTALGFLPDGRFLAFKGVTSEFYSAHVGADGTKFRHHIGDICEMPRSAVDPDPNRTCSTGLHVGAPGYVKDHYSGASYALVLVAVDPVDVVCVPVDYHGEKMRVCRYEVIDHLDQDYSDELLGKLKTTASHAYGTTGYSAAPVPPATPASENVAFGLTQAEIDADEGVEGDDPDENVWGEEDEEDDFAWANGIAVGDVLNFHETGSERYGVVTEVDGLNEVVIVFGPDATSFDVTEDDLIAKISASDVIGSMVATIGDTVTIAGHSVIRDGDYVIEDIDESTDQGDGDSEFFSVTVPGLTDPVAITNGLIQAVKRNDATFWPMEATKMVADVCRPATIEEVKACLPEFNPLIDLQVGDKVSITGSDWPPAGIYPVASVSPLVVATEHDGDCVVEDLTRVSEAISRPWTRVVIGNTVTLRASDLSGVSEGNYEVLDVQPDWNDVFPEGQLQVRTTRGPWWIDAARVTAVTKA